MGTVIRIDALYFRRKRERTTAQLRAELDPLTRAWLREFVAEMARQEAFNDVMLTFAEENS